MLTAGEKLGAHQVIELIGSGGMGEVYHAHDTKLGRDVAIKVLPEAFAHDPQRLSRFQREAKLLTSLNHPSIATIHGLEESNGRHYLVMELVPGETLRERKSAGLLVVLDQREGIDSGQLFAAVEEGQLDGEGRAGHFSAEFAHQLNGRGGSASGGEQIVAD
jgi:hypothetical protein